MPIRGRVVLIWVAFGMFLAGGTALLVYQADQFAKVFARTQKDRQGLLREQDDLRQALQTVQQDFARLRADHLNLTGDRDNVLAQVKRLMEEQGDVDASLKLYEKVIKKVSQENLLLKGRLEPLERAHAVLEQAHEAAVKERDTIRAELDRVADHKEEKRLKTALSEAQAKLQKQAVAHKEAADQLKALKSQEGQIKKQLAERQQELEALEEKHATILSENTKLKRRSQKAPEDVTRLAREHERMVKALADTHYNLGVLFTEKQDFVRAAKEFHQVVELAPQDPDALYNLGLIYAEHLPDREKAEQYFRRYLQTGPSPRDASWVKQYIVSWKAWDAQDKLE